MAENEKLNNVAVDNDVGTMEDVDAIMKKYDRESNTRIWEGTPRKILRVLTALFGIFLIVMNMWIKMDERARRPLFLGLVIILVFIYYPIKKGSQKVNYMPWYDIVMAAVGAFCFFFYPLNLEKIVTAGTRIQKIFFVQIGGVTIPLLIVFAIIGTLILVECCRRVVGMPIICVATVFVLYAFLGAGKDLKTVMYNLFYTTTGILGTPIGVCSTYIALFVIFGAFLEATGVANFFIDCANALVGWASGGPAKVAVVSSALCGMVSGSSVGNTVTTGSVTIPMMKKTGYPPEFAGAVEAASSTGGQIMHTEFDDLNRLNELLPGRVQKNLHDASAIVTGMLLDISPNTEAGIAAGKAAASAAAQEESSSIDNSIEENVSEDSSFENDTSESIESETQNASLDEPNESAASVIESDHKFMTGLFAAAAIVLILFVVFLLTAALTANQRRRKRIRRFGEDYKKKKY